MRNLLYTILLTVTFFSCSSIPEKESPSKTNNNSHKKGTVYYYKRIKNENLNMRVIHAWKLYHNGYYKQSSQEFEKIISSGQTHYDILFGAGISYKKYYDNKKALKYFTLTLNKFPTHFGALYYRGMLFNEAKNFKSSRRDLSKIAASEFKSPFICGLYKKDYFSKEDFINIKDKAMFFLKQ